jgi:outer membrane protein insertion porin family
MTRKSKRYQNSISKGKLILYRIGKVMILLLATSCSGTKYLKEGATFYSGAQIKINTTEKVGGKKRLVNNLEQYLLPKANPVILGSRPGVWFYYRNRNPDKKKGLENSLKKKFGTPPILLADATPNKTAEKLEMEVNNNGYFQSTVEYEVKTKGKKSSVIYTIDLKSPYHLRNIKYALLNSSGDTLLYDLTEGSLLKENQRYSLDRLKNEQERIEEVAKNNGFYYFDDRYLRFDADSTIGNKQVDLILRFEEDVPPEVKQVYWVRDINIFSNYTLSNDTSLVSNDTINLDGFKYYDYKTKFRPQIITDAINMRPDSIYRELNHEYTLSRLMSLKTFKYVNIKFNESSVDSSALNADIFLTPLLKKSIRLEGQGVSKSNNFVGPGLGVTFTNRNLLRGAEMFQIKVNGAYEWQISRQQSGALNAIEFGTEASLTAPRFISPFRIRNSSSKYLPHTQLKVGYNFQDRLSYYRLTTFNIAYGYSWRETTSKTHELFPADISFVKSSHTSQDFNDLLEDNPTLANSFQNQFIIGSRYSFTYNSQLKEDIAAKFTAVENRRSDIYFNGIVDFSGNLVNALQRIGSKEENSFTFLGSPYSQFARLDLDFRYYFKFSKKSKLATRINTAGGYAYGNSNNLPYIKQFSVGGSNSLRAFPARSVGPGTYNVRTDTTITSDTYFIDQRGDMKLEMNVEYRFDILKALKGACFVDSGNIWLWKEDPLREGSEFKASQFMKELAVGTGIGLRYDFNFFLLRFDLAFPIRKPYLPELERWVFNEIDFGSREWRRENLIFNIAFGYPF